MPNSSQEPIYISLIPEEAVEEVVDRHDSGLKSGSNYMVASEKVGERHFDENGRLCSESSWKNGSKDGWYYEFNEEGQVTFRQSYSDGSPHGLGCQWSSTGELMGCFEIHHGTGLDLWWSSTQSGAIYLLEVEHLRQGQWHGFSWRLNEDQKSVYSECNWSEGQKHGIERWWSTKEKLARGYPRFYVSGQQVSRAKYNRIRSLADPSLMEWRPEDDRPDRVFPEEVDIYIRDVDHRTRRINEVEN